MVSGTLPPFSATFRITALCRAMFCSALPCAPAFTFSSCASSLRALSEESSSRSLSTSTFCSVACCWPACPEAVVVDCAPPACCWEELRPRSLSKIELRIPMDLLLNDVSAGDQQLAYPGDQAVKIVG